MTPWQRELERRTWANQNRRRRSFSDCHFKLERLAMGGREDMLAYQGLVEWAVSFAMKDRERRRLNRRYIRAR